MNKDEALDIVIDAALCYADVLLTGKRAAEIYEAISVFDSLGDNPLSDSGYVEPTTRAVCRSCGVFHPTGHQHFKDQS